MRVADQNGWSGVTVKTLLNRLMKKQAITAAKEGRRYLYSPTIPRETYVNAESENLINRLFGGRIAPLVTHFSERQKLSADDIAELKKLIEEIENDG